VERRALRRDERLPRSTPASTRAGALTVNRWIASATRDCARSGDAALEAYRFDEAANRLYAVRLGQFCDWYLEFTKPILQGDDATAQAETRATIGWVLAQIVHLLHPIMPYVTEEVWAQLGGTGAGMLLTAKWPELAPDLHDPQSAAEMEWVVAAISAIRAVRSEMNVPPAARVPLLVKDADATVAAARPPRRAHPASGAGRKRSPDDHGAAGVCRWWSRARR
jgi:valyl-tRNA synthetase